MRTVKPQKNPKTFFIFEKENKGTVKTYTDVRVTAHTVWGIYNFGKKSFTGCKTICENSYYYVVSK